MWQISTLTCLLVALVAVAGNIHLGSQSKYVPYIVEVDKLGRCRSFALAASATADPRVIKTTIANIVTDARNVSVWPHDTAQIHTFSLCTFELKRCFNKQDERVLKWQSRNQSICKSQERNRWGQYWISYPTINWNMASRLGWDRKGQKGMQRTPYHMRGLFTIYQSAPSPSTQEDQMLKNPLGIYIKRLQLVKTNLKIEGCYKWKIGSNFDGRLALGIIQSTTVNADPMMEMYF